MIASTPIRVTPQSWPSVRVTTRGPVTIIFADGIYDYLPVFAGMNGATFRAENPWRAIIQPPVHGVEVYPSVQDVTVSGFAIYAPRGCGVKSLAKSGVLIDDCYIAHSGQSGAYGVHHSFRVRNCLIERCGRDPIHDHGIYFANAPLCSVEGSVIRHNAGLGIAPCPAAQRLTIRGNLVHHNGQGGLSWSVFSLSSGQPSIIEGNTFADNANWDVHLSENGTSQVCPVALNWNILEDFDISKSLRPYLGSYGGLRSAPTYYTPALDCGWRPSDRISVADAYCHDPASDVSCLRILTQGA